MKGILFSFFIIVGLCNSGFALSYNTDTTTDVFNENEIIVRENVVVNSGSGYINIDKQGTFIENNGIINAILDTNGNNLRIKNSGNIGCYWF